MLPANWAMQVHNPERYEFFCYILRQTDRPDLVGVMYGQPRGHRLTAEGRPNRRRIWRRLVVGYIASFWAEHFPDDEEWKVKKTPRPRVWTLARDGRL